MSELKYPIGIQSFPDLINDGCVYIDKTEYLERLLKNRRSYFLSRPRRFGKSLFISTLEAYFHGRRELFKGLHIDRDDVDWTPRPVFRLDLSAIDVKSVDSLTDKLDYYLRQWENVYDVNGYAISLPDRFDNVLRTAYQKTGRQAVILIDEYDAPILLSLESKELNSAVRDELQSFYKVIKSASDYIKYSFITGVSRFTHTTIFSGLNNLDDISENEDYAGICGITEEEMHRYLTPGVEDLAVKSGVSTEEAFDLLKHNYDGYHFMPGSPDIYNPFSVLRALNNRKIGAYWFQTATPSYLVRMLRQKSIELPSLQDGCFIRESEMTVSDPHLANPIALMYQTGYLTIDRYDSFLEGYWLQFPNREVEKGFIEHLFPLYVSQDRLQVEDCLRKLKLHLLNGESETFMLDLQSILAGFPADREEIRTRETYFENKLFVVLKMLGFDVRTQQGTSFSRMDMMIKMPYRIYVCELKVNSSAEEALHQIDEKDYALPFRHLHMPVVKIGINYSSRINNIDSWAICEE